MPDDLNNPRQGTKVRVALWPLSTYIVVAGLGFGVLAVHTRHACAQTAAQIVDITWALGPNYPSAIKGDAAGFIDNTLVSAGGEHVPDNSTHDSNLTYGLPVGGTSWESLPNMPQSTAWLSGQVVNNTLYVAGGRSNFQSIGATYSLTQQNGTWQWNTLDSLNTPRGFFFMGQTQGKLFVEGGYQFETSTFVNAPELFDTNNPQAGWKNVAPFPGVVREYPTVAGVGGNFYVFGGTAPPGYMGSDSDRLSDAYEYHTATNTWTQLPASPIGISNAASVVYGERYIIMMGGAAQGDITYQPGYYNNHVEVFDTLRGTYTTMTSLMPYGTAEMGVAVSGNTIYAIGGESAIAADSNTESWLQVGQIVASLPADANHDGVVNGLDINLVSSHWLQTGAGIAGDVNSDNVVNGLDIDTIAAEWLQSTVGGAGSGGITVPEPTAGTLAGMELVCIAGGLTARWMARFRRAASKAKRVNDSWRASSG
jgi:sialate O-acetylesterase